jgi:hypothetical protein
MEALKSSAALSLFIVALTGFAVVDHSSAQVLGKGRCPNIGVQRGFDPEKVSYSRKHSFPEKADSQNICQRM